MLGSLEIPLQAKLLAKTGRCVIIVAADLIVDGCIYRQEFVARAVLDALMNLQPGLEIPILFLVTTPPHFHEIETHRSFLFDHFKINGTEAANACAMTLKNLDTITDSTNIN